MRNKLKFTLLNISHDEMKGHVDLPPKRYYQTQSALQVIQDKGEASGRTQRKAPSKKAQKKIDKKLRKEHRMVARFTEEDFPPLTQNSGSFKHQTHKNNQWVEVASIGTPCAKGNLPFVSTQNKTAVPSDFFAMSNGERSQAIRHKAQETELDTSVCQTAKHAIKVKRKRKPKGLAKSMQIQKLWKMSEDSVLNQLAYRKIQTHEFMQLLCVETLPFYVMFSNCNGKADQCVLWDKSQTDDGPQKPHITPVVRLPQKRPAKPVRFRCTRGEELTQTKVMHDHYSHQRRGPMKTPKKWFLREVVKPILMKIKTSTISPAYLKTKFGANYIEGRVTPRCFSIDLSNETSALFENGHKEWERTAILVFQHLKDGTKHRQMECQGILFEYFL